MTSETEQLAHDFEEVNKILTQYPQIHVAQTEGNPPATYEVEYQINALIRQGDGNIEQNGHHLLRINLPFGYPHFPPTVKPLTPLFHPDIDPDAVRISSQWQQNPSLADLIIHIGEMLCAQKFNLEEPFNQEAADWYSEHSADFPLDDIQQSDTEELVAEDLSLEDDLGLSLEIDGEEENIDEQLEEIKHHIEKNEVVTAGKLLATLASSSSEAQALQQTVSSALDKRDSLLKELEELENDDRFSDAYEIFKKIKKIAIDTPALSDIGQRLQQSQAMLDTFSQPVPVLDEQEVEVEQKEKKSSKKKKAKKNTPEKAKQKEKTSITRKHNKPRIIIPVKTILAAGILLVAGGACILVYTTSMDKLMTAEQDWIEIKYQRCATPQECKQKRVKSEKILTSIKSVYAPGIGKEALEEEIYNLINSAEFKAKEKGNQDYKGHSLPTITIEILEPLDKKLDKAAHSTSLEKYAEALLLYKEIQASAEAAKISAVKPHAQKTNDELDKRISTTKDKIKELEQLAAKEEKLAQRKMTEEAYAQALELFNELEKKKSSELASDVEINDQWEACIEVLENTQKKLRKHPEINFPERQEKLAHLQVFAQLYKKLALARNSYVKGELTTAITEYNEALRLLKNNRSALATIYQDALPKIHKTITRLKVSLELRMAVEAENRNTLQTSLAHYRKSLQLLRSSSSRKDSSFRQLERYIRSKIDEQSLKTAKSSNQEWWQKNYERIFKKEFPSTRVSLLSKPRIHFVKVKNGKLLYIIRCSERGITLELNYQYNLATGTWSPYYGKL
jgi:ubiquitin-protein ligase